MWRFNLNRDQTGTPTSCDLSINNTRRFRNMKLTDKQIERIKNIAKSYGLKLVLLFGSQVSQSFLNKESDFDVAYLPEKKIDFQSEYYLNYEFTKVFKSDRVDTVNLKKAAPLLFYAIFQNCQILYEKESLLFPTWRAYAFKRYIESKPFYEEKYKKLEAQIAAY